MKSIFSGLICGLLFGIGLTISTMVDPARVLGFLDIFGQWDPTLAFVMGGGLAVYLPIFYLVVKPKQKTLFNEQCHIPTNTQIDKKLLTGAAIFGIGWGLGGYCPGPAFTSVGAGSQEALTFGAAMLVGVGAYQLYTRFREGRTGGPADPQAAAMIDG